MRLIDKDEILNLIGAIVSKFPEEYDEKTYKMIRREIRNKNREVKAIPIEWIENQIKRTTDITDEKELDLIYAGNLGYMLKLWEKENETN